MHPENGTTTKLPNLSLIFDHVWIICGAITKRCEKGCHRPGLASCDRDQAQLRHSALLPCTRRTPASSRATSSSHKSSSSNLPSFWFHHPLEWGRGSSASDTLKCQLSTVTQSFRIARHNTCTLCSKQVHIRQV